ncbi:MAG: carbamoyltransferase [Candidatus Omnitrophica bacterium]|nr:carbamoyltransferase [Candidatus Omnitrophota bacterium]
MNILGLSALDKESTATILRDGAIVAAVSEERLTRVKQQGGFPYQAVASALALSGLTAREIDVVAYPFFHAHEELALLGGAALRDLSRWTAKVRYRGLRHTLRHYGAFGKALGTAFPSKLLTCDRQLAEGLKALGIRGRRRRYDHQYCHAVSAYYTSQFDRALVATLDWYGSGKAGAIYLAEGGRLRLIKTIHFPDSLGVMYAGVTSALGFIPDRHEGKVVGLAAYGDPSRLAPGVLQRFAARATGDEFLDALDLSAIRTLVASHTREDVAAAHQHALETVVLKQLSCYLQRFRVDHVAVAGGVFANVKLNERIVEHPGVASLFVHPAMGDMGSGTGAALAAALEAGDLREPVPMVSAFLGPSVDEQAIEAAVTRLGLPYRHEPDMPRRIAELLAHGKIVGRCIGRMEYGPRALGNRSVLASTVDASVTERLNQKLRRNDFMPFAPATLASAAGRCYDQTEKVRHAAQFMTVCLSCTPWMRQASPAAVHVDGTARPQFVTPDSNPDLHQILIETERLTGIPSVINTSFNIHEEPIVCSPDDAVRGFLEAGLDALAIGNILVRRAPATDDRMTDGHHHIAAATTVDSKR